MKKETDEDESIPEKTPPMSIENVPRIFFEAQSPESCILSILSDLPPIFDESFEASLAQKIELAESSITVVTEHLTNDVLSSQQQIFDATDTFLSLNDNIVESSDFIHSIRDQVSTVRSQTLNPILNILTSIRDLRRDTKALTVLHFVRYLTLFYDAINSSNLVWATYTLLQTQYLLFKEKSIYNLSLFDSFVGFSFKNLPTNVSPVPIEITIGELKKVKCIKNILNDIYAFTPQLMSKFDHQLKEHTENFIVDKYCVIVVAYCLLSDDPPIARVLFESCSKQIRSRSVAYFESKSNDLQTLFKFMENSCTIISNFKQFNEFHQTHQTFGSFVSELPIDIDVVLLERLPPDKEMHEKIMKLSEGLKTSYSQLTHVAESNVLQFLSRLNCTNLDALSFIRLTRALKEFNTFIKCNGLTDWIKITAADFMSKYSSASNSSIKQAVLSDSWVPTHTDNDFLSLIQTMPSTNEVVFKSDNLFDAFASSSSITTVRVIHSLICLSLELDATACFNLIVQVSTYYVACVMNSFSYPLNAIEGNELNRKIAYLFDSNFLEGCRNAFKLIPNGVSLPEQKSYERNEAQLMQMITATDGLSLLMWYLQGIRENLIKRASKGACLDKVNKFYASLVDGVLPNFRKNFSAVIIKSFIVLKNLKYQIFSSSWALNEVTIEYHQFVFIAKKAFEVLDKTLLALQLKRSIMNDIWYGTWSYISYVLISSFATVRNCNGFGRSLMASDARMISSFFRSISKMDADTTNVLEYVNAYFYQMNEFSHFIDVAPTKYKQKHIINLVKTGLNCKLSANDTKALLSKIESKYAAMLYR
ncbi:hypothetical protein TRFO_18153 [Tritrichomonas foetus]|uniref:Syndetin C-terminal domain-containing protein n=1 Tax=Tritrichomonas foetus TaxID=1144522 RepID=A0A1J4KMK7_9EUKA|nr:hypothetical protein TRFO_18153 [Tritrichomonas foetus]|eukprot:OHT12160.1 hypothetical protein TRFO_18153 [Tritrichomonas foetus]